jgi:hypothetical protein
MRFGRADTLTDLDYGYLFKKRKFPMSQFLTITILAMFCQKFVPTANQQHFAHVYFSRPQNELLGDELAETSATAVFVQAADFVANGAIDSDKAILETVVRQTHESLQRELRSRDLDELVDLNPKLFLPSLQETREIGRREKRRKNAGADLLEFNHWELQAIATALDNLPPELSVEVRCAMERIKLTRVGLINYLKLMAKSEEASGLPDRSTLYTAAFSSELAASRRRLDSQLLTYYRNVLKALPVRVQQQLQRQLGFTLDEVPQWQFSHRSNQNEILGPADHPLIGIGRHAKFSWDESWEKSDSRYLTSRFGTMQDGQRGQIGLIAQLPPAYCVNAAHAVSAIRQIDILLLRNESPGENKLTSEQVMFLQHHRELLARWETEVVSLTMAEWDIVLGGEQRSEPVRLYISELGTVKGRQPVHQITNAKRPAAIPPVLWLDGRIGNLGALRFLKEIGALGWFAEISESQWAQINELDDAYSSTNQKDSQNSLRLQRELFEKLNEILTPGQAVSVFQFMYLQIGTATYFSHPGVANEYGLLPEEREFFFNAVQQEFSLLQKLTRHEIQSVLEGTLSVLSPAEVTRLEARLGLSMDQVIDVYKYADWNGLVQLGQPRDNFYFMFGNRY